MSENYSPIKIILTIEQAKRLAAFLEDHIFNGMSDICESVNYQIDHKEFKLLVKDNKEYIPSFFGGSEPDYKDGMN